MTVIEYGQWVGNKNIPSFDPESTISVENPSDNTILATVPAGCAQDAQHALELAKKAQPAWSKKTSIERANLLRTMATIIRENRDELSRTLATEQAKVLSLAQVEIDATISYFEMYGGMAYAVEGEIVNSDNVGENIYVHYAPIGVEVGICPWNFPFLVMARKVAPALLAGCTVVVKTSELTPLTTFLFTSYVQKAIEDGRIDNLEPGVMSVVTGYGHTIGEALCTSTIPDMISMTGSVVTGKKIMSYAAKNMTKVNLELGGKAPAIVMEDCDLDATVDAIVASRVIFSGQVCNCAERCYVQKSIYDTFVDKLVAKMKSMKVGKPLDGTDEGDSTPKPDLCSLVSKEQLLKVEGMVDRATEAGGKLLCGGKRIEGPGYHYEPTVIVGVEQSSEIIRNEIFGPVLPVMSFETFDEALALANDCDYGLASSVFTNNYRYIERARTELLFGETYINRFHFEAIQGFHAGWRNSGIGGTDGRHGLMEHYQTKVIYVQR